MKRIKLETYCEYGCPMGDNYACNCDEAKTTSISFKVTPTTMRKALNFKTNKETIDFAKDEAIYDDNASVLEYCLKNNIPIQISSDCKKIY